MFLKIIRLSLVTAGFLAMAAPALASPITMLVGDKDWFGSQLAGQVPAASLMPFDDSQLFDFRSAPEKSATNGAQLTDIYSALYPTVPSMCGDTDDPGCGRPDTGSVIF